MVLRHFGETFGGGRITTRFYNFVLRKAELRGLLREDTVYASTGM